MSLTLLDLPDFGPSNDLSDLTRAVNERLRQLVEFLNDLDPGTVTTITRGPSSTTVTGSVQVVFYKPLTAAETIGAPSLEQVPVGSVAVFILRQPVGSSHQVSWAAAFRGHPGSVPLRSDSYSVFRFYRVSEAEFLLLDVPLLGEEAA